MAPAVEPTGVVDGKADELGAACEAVSSKLFALVGEKALESTEVSGRVEAYPAEPSATVLPVVAPATVWPRPVPPAPAAVDGERPWLWEDWVVPSPPVPVVGEEGVGVCAETVEMVSR